MSDHEGRVCVLGCMAEGGCVCVFIILHRRYMVWCSGVCVGVDMCVVC